MATFLAGTDALGERLDEFVGTPSSTSVLARGPSLATAYQGAFNLKEMARFFAEPMSAAQFRHGPIEVAAPGHLAMLFAPLGATFTLLRKLTEELLGFGTRVMFVTDTQESLRHDGEACWPSAIPTWTRRWRPLVNLMPLQLFANARAERLGQHRRPPVQGIGGHAGGVSQPRQLDVHVPTFPSPPASWTPGSPGTAQPSAWRPPGIPRQARATSTGEIAREVTAAGPDAALLRDRVAYHPGIRATAG